MRILALDPATHTGWAHSDGEFGVWHLGSGPIGEKLLCLRRSMFRAMRDHPFECLAYEDAVMGAKSFATQNFHARVCGVIELVATELGVTTWPFNIGTIKKFATGDGRAKKPQMMRACKTILGIETADDNEADALWILELAKQGPPTTTTAKARPRASKRNPARLF